MNFINLKYNLYLNIYRFIKYQHNMQERAETILNAHTELHTAESLLSPDWLLKTMTKSFCNHTGHHNTYSGAQVITMATVPPLM